MEMDERDLFEDYDIRINRKFTSLLLSEQENTLARKDHKVALPTKRIKTMPTNDYLRKYSELMSQAPAILPSGCRYIEPLGNGDTIYVIEQQPQFRTVAMNLNFDIMYNEIRTKKLLKEYGIENWLNNPTHNSNTGNYYKLNLAFPYVIFIIYLNQNYQIQVGYSFLRVNPMIGLSDYLLKMPLTNISDNQAICFGGRLNKKTYNTAPEAIDGTIDVFWTSVFNTDYTYNLKAYDNVAGISNYLEWQHLSRTDPMFIYRVDWIQNNSNIFQMITEIKRYMISGGKRLDAPDSIYKDFLKTFSKPIKIGEIKTGKIRKKILPIYYDISSGIYLTDTLRAEIGDSFTNESKTKTYHIISFLGVQGSNPNTIRLSYNDKLFNFKINKISQEYLKDRMIAEKYLPTMKLKGGLSIKADDILKYKDKAGHTVYRRVFYVRPGLDNRPEVRLGNQYHIAANLPKDVEIFNQEQPNIYGMNLMKSDEYYYSHSAGQKNVMYFQVERCVYDSIDVGQNNSLVFKFNSTDRTGRNLSILLNDVGKTSQRVFPAFDKKKVVMCNNDEIVSAGRMMKRFIHSNPDDDRNQVYKTPNGYLYFTTTNYDNVVRSSIKQLIIKDKKFQVDTHFGLLEYEIGDLVVVANWKDPLSVLNIRRIEGFKVEDKDKETELTFILMDKNGTLSQEVFITNSNIRTGYIRKIVTKFEELSSGTKIIATAGNIANFPKKDINIVIGIIIDGPNPLVLCSNGCTLWYQDVIKKFKIISMDSDEWSKKDHVPLDPKKIKFQSGDIVVPSYADSSKDQGYLMVQTMSSQSLKYHPLSYYGNGSAEAYTADKSFQDECIFDCIPNPRIGKAQQDKDGFIPANLNFHGGLIPIEGSSFLYVTDPRSLINVPNSDS